MCHSCHKPAKACVCASVARVDNRTGIYVLQHPRERHHAVGTERLARLGLRHARIEVRGPREHRERPAYLPDDIALLYPGGNARELAGLTAAERPANLLVLDGTWTHTRTMYRDWNWLHSLPHVKLTPPRPSQYRIRAEPRAECVSTIEAIVYALQILEPDTRGLEKLLESFSRMIDTQVDLSKKNWNPRPKHRMASASRRRGGLLHCVPAHLIVGYAEFLPRAPGHSAQLVYWTAVRPSTGALFEFVLRPSSDAHASVRLAEAGLAMKLVEAGRTREEFEAAWRQFCTDQDVVAAWNQSTLTLLTYPLPAHRVELKRVYCNFRRVKAGHLDEVVAREGLSFPPMPLQGRAAARLSQAACVAEHLRQQSLVRDLKRLG